MESSFFSPISPFWTCCIIFITDLFTLIKTLKYPHSTPSRHKHKLAPGPKPWPIIGNDDGNSGHNPSNAVEWALTEMINQPELLQKATEELDKVVGKDRVVQGSDIPKLDYIKACIREAFRLHPIGPFNVPHVSVCDAVVPNYFIPRGSHVLLSRQELGRNPKVWKDDPLKFKPERHLVDDGSDVFLTEPELSFISFSTGKRGCPGVVLGTTITVMLFARLLHVFTWSAPPHEPIELVESRSDLLLAKPLVAIVNPRLSQEVYLLD